MSEITSSPEPARPLFREGQTIVLDGDSRTSRRVGPALVTWPYLRMNNWQVTWADRFEEWIFCNRPELQLKLYNAAVGGSAAADVQQRYEAMVKPLKPDWVILSVGSNDRFRTTPAALRTTLADYAQRLRGDSSGRLLLLVTHPPGRYGEPIPDAALWCDSMREAVAAHGGRYVDLSTAIAEKERALKTLWEHHTIRTGPDDHFNAIGAEIISTLMLQACGLISITSGTTP